VARAEFLASGLEFEYGSQDEAIAIWRFNNKRTENYLSAMISAVDPKSIEKVMKSLRSTMFPEERMNDLMYIKKSMNMFDKLRKYSFKINTVD